jgi:hypothetical protein
MPMLKNYNNFMHSALLLIQSELIVMKNRFFRFISLFFTGELSRSRKYSQIGMKKKSLGSYEKTEKN